VTRDADRLADAKAALDAYGPRPGARALNAAGVPSPRGKSWHPASLVRYVRPGPARANADAQARFRARQRLTGGP